MQNLHQIHVHADKVWAEGGGDELGRAGSPAVHAAVAHHPRHPSGDTAPRGRGQRGRQQRCTEGAEGP